MELDILLLLSIKDNYYKYNKYIKDYTLTKECNLILRDMDYYYTKNPTYNIVKWSDFSTWFCAVKHSSWNEQVLKTYQIIFKKLEKKSSGDMPNEEIVKHFVTMDYATKIFNEVAKIAEGLSNDMTPVYDLVNEHQSSMPDDFEDSSVLTDNDLEDYILDASNQSGYAWRLECLNDSIGHTGIGDLICVGGRPDSGKTTLLASEATHRASIMPQGKHVIWINNEERGQKVRLRQIQSAIQKTKDEVFSNVPKAIEEYQAVVGGEDRIIIKDSASVDVTEVEKLIKEYPPALIIIDQLSKLVSTKSGKLNEAQRIQALGEQARQWAKDHCTVIFTIWADGSAEGEKWIEMNQLYGSKTGVQGECDAIITIGRSNEETVADRNKRYIYIPKNKICGGDSLLINGKFDVAIEPVKARFKNG
jgi:replicative DNA helicase